MGATDSKGKRDIANTPEYLEFVKQQEELKQECSRLQLELQRSREECNQMEQRKQQVKRKLAQVLHEKDTIHQELLFTSKEKEQLQFQLSEALSQLSSREGECERLQHSLSKAEEKLFGETADTHSSEDEISNAYRRLYEEFIEEGMVESQEALGRSFRETVNFAHSILMKAFAIAALTRQRMLTTTAFMELSFENKIEAAQVFDQIAMVNQKILLKKSAHKVLEMFKMIVLSNLEREVRESSGEDWYEKVWKSFVPKCVDVAWKCQWHNINDDLSWSLNEECPTVWLDELTKSKDFLMHRSTLTVAEIQEIDEDAGRKNIFLIWPMLIAHEGIRQRLVFAKYTVIGH
eukprot:TRINITY_DN2590_c0_g1_i1.p1 TRINITY_DN2590_c0_g1~~TRINITY_DN2590_c0_g1_i1.p1  ORF type:complete len:348 (-),score=99.35 TRINITY_DN2590_c0_g1_i1:59-1102(-)